MKSSEKRLLYIMLGIAVLGGVFVLSNIYFDKRDALVSKNDELKEEWETIEFLFEEREMWEMRANWLQANQPKFTTSVEISNSIFDDAQAKNVDGVEASKQVLLKVKEEPHYVEAGVSLEAKGELTPLCRWIYDLSKPEEFRVVRNLTITPDKEEPETVIAKFELVRWYAPNNQ